MSEQEKFEGWAILELMGHRKLGGYLHEATIAGAAFIRIDVPAFDPGGGQEGQIAATQFYSPSAVYAITPTTEDLAKAMAARYQPEPVTRWELPRLPEPRDPYPRQRAPEPDREQERIDAEISDEEGEAADDIPFDDDREPIQPGDYRYYRS